MTDEERAALVAAWVAEERYPFVGWDFAYLQGRMCEESPPWDYAARAAKLLRGARAALDLGTGGGERLLALREFWPPVMAVTEEYPPNLRLATERLAPLGVQVVPARLSDDDPLPFADGAFGLVLNRHSGFNAREVARMLVPSGTFLTQQMHAQHASELMAAFGAASQWPDATPDKYVPQLRAAGLAIVDVREWRGALRYTDVGAIVYHLHAVPWLVPDFSVSTHLEHLLALQNRLERGEPLVFDARSYLIEARRV